MFISTYFYDSLMIRRVYEVAVLISQSGPMLFYWVGFAEVIFYINNTLSWSNLETWVFLSIYTVYIIIAMFIQILILPKVFEWIELSPI